MITLYQYAPAFGLSNVSSFCAKVETLLRMAGLEYKPEYIFDTDKMPKGKAPVIEEDGQMIADSTFISAYVAERHGFDADATLNAYDKAASRVTRVMIEERLYWCVVYANWIDDANWPTVKAEFFAAVPEETRDQVAEEVRDQVRSDLWAQGVGRHSSEEIYDLGTGDIAALATLLGDSQYFMGNKPTLLDATAHGIFATLLIPQLNSPLKTEVEKHANLMAYVERMNTVYYPSVKAA